MTIGREPAMELRVLGPLEVTLGGEVLALGSPKQRALLAVLVMSANRVVAVDRLVEELWGDEAPARAMSSLQAYISRLRRLMQPTAATRGRSDVLVTQAPGYLIRLDPSSIDAVRFESYVAEGIRVLSAGDAAAALSSLEGALLLWRGAPYGDFSFEEFAQAEITRLGELRLAAIEARLSALVETGQAAAAIAEAEAVVHDHPLREGIWASLMTALYRSGRQGDALRTYQRARRAIGEELGIEPGRALQELETRILRQSVDLDPVLGRSGAVVALTTPEPLPAPPVSAPPVSAPPAEAPLVGRVQELRNLSEAVAAAAGGGGRVMVIHGEPGIGKTRLAQQAARQAGQAGGVVGYGNCVEGHVTAAYWPWTHALRQLLDGLEPGDVAPPVGEALAELAQLDPSLGRWAHRNAAVVPLADPDLARARLQHAAVDAVVGLAVMRPVTLVLEDLQWADQSSLQLLSLIAAELAGTAVLVVATYRDQEVGSALAATLGTFGRLGDTVDVALEGLDPASVHRFVELTADQEVSEAVGTSIATRTAGNPLFVAELTRLLRSERALDERGVLHAPVPAGVREVIRRRLERLPPQTTTVLTVAAIIGRRFDLGLLEQVAQLPEDELLDRVESAVAIGLVAEGDGAPGDFSFTHDLVRATLQAALSGTRRVRLHARVARALLEHGDESDPARPFALSHHLREALPVVPAEEVVAHVLGAADAAVRGLAFEQAEVQLEAALALAVLLPAGQRAAHELVVRVQLARVLTYTRGYASPEVRQHADRAMDLTASVEPRPDTIEALWATALAAGVAADFATALAIGRRLLAWGKEHGDPTASCLGHTLVGAYSFYVGALDTSARHLELAVEMVDVEGLDLRFFYDGTLAGGVSMVSVHAHVAWSIGRDEKATALIADAAHRAERLGHEIGVLYALCWDAWLAVFRQNFAHARRRAEDVIVRADALGYRQFCVMGRILAGSAHQDPFVRARELRDAVVGWEASGARVFQTFFLTLQADAEIELGRSEQADALLTRALDAAEATGERFYEPEIHRLLGVVALQQGRADEAATRYGRAREVASELGLVALGERVESCTSAKLRPL